MTFLFIAYPLDRTHSAGFIKVIIEFNEKMAAIFWKYLCDFSTFTRNIHDRRCTLWGNKSQQFPGFGCLDNPSAGVGKQHPKDCDSVTSDELVSGR
jgi:hypothetical protein